MNATIESSDKHEKALIRNLDETISLLSKRNAANKLSSEIDRNAFGFFRYAYEALFNDCIAHGIKVLDNHPDCFSFWYLYKIDEVVIDEFLNKKNSEIGIIITLSDKLKYIRDKTHFHLDKIGTLDAMKVWIDANMWGTEFNTVFELILEILNHLHSLHKSNYHRDVIYLGEDIGSIMKTVRSAGIEK